MTPAGLGAFHLQGEVAFHLQGEVRQLFVLPGAAQMNSFPDGDPAIAALARAFSVRSVSAWHRRSKFQNHADSIKSTQFPGA